MNSSGNDDVLIRAPIATSMTEPIAWETAFANVVRHDTNLERHRYALGALRIRDDVLYAGDRRLSLDKEGVRRLFGRFQAPPEYVRRLGPRLRAVLFAFHVLDTTRKAKSECEDVIVLSRDGQFRGFDRADLHRLAGADVLETVRDAINQNVLVHNLDLGHEAFQLDIVSPASTQEARVGDALRYGLRVRHSLVGDYATTIESFALRLICGNGLIQRECIGAKRTARSRPRSRRLLVGSRDADTKQRDQIRQLATNAWRRLQDVAKGIRQLQDRPFEHGSMARFLRQARMYSDRLMTLVQAAWAAEGAERTAYGALNALTRVATHDASLSMQQRRRLELLAGVFAGQAAHLCPRCFGLTL